MKRRPTRAQLNLADAIQAVSAVNNYELAFEFAAQIETPVCIRCGTTFGYTRVPVRFTGYDNVVLDGFMHHSCARSAVSNASRQLTINWRRRPHPGRLYLSR